MERYKAYIPAIN